MPLNHTHEAYDNYVLANEIEDQYNSRLDLTRFCTIDNSLEGTPGMKKTIRVYSATSGAEDVAMGSGNTKDIEISYDDDTYTVLTTQARFPYYDEELMKDPKVVETGVGMLSTDMFNSTQSKIYAEFLKSQLAVQTGATTTVIDFDHFADAVAALNLDDGDAEVEIFGFVNPKDKAALRKALKDDLQYVEAFVRKGYIGTVCGCNLYVDKRATEGIISIATKKAVTFFTKEGTIVEQERDPNARLNKIYARKYYVPALTNADYAVLIIRGVEIATSSATATVVAGAKVDLGATITLNSASPLTWASATVAKATVSAAGLVTGVAAGTSKITATTINGNSVEITVTVT